MSDDKAVRYDIQSFDVITTAVRDLLDEFPGLNSGEYITFSVLGDTSGKAVYPISSGVIQTELNSITDHVTQVCLYPFYVIYRVAGPSEQTRANVKEWLDNLGRWLEKQEVTINGETHRIETYPTLTGDRRILKFERQTPGYLEAVNDNKSEDWIIQIAMQYQNEFER